jgi:hypothetical protein
MTKRIERGRPSGRPRFSVLAGVVLASAAIAAGCGGDDGGDSTSSEARDDFIAQADQICVESGERVDAQAKKRFGASGAADDQQVIDLYSEVTIPELQKMFDQIGELTPPPGDEDQIDEILSTADEALAEAEDEPANLAKPVGQGNPFDETNELLQDYGFEVCGGGNA